jgi:hypothetical protein
LNRITFTIALLAVAACSFGKGAATPSDRQLKLWAVRWFTGSYGSAVHGAPLTATEAKRRLLALPSKTLIRRFEAIQGSRMVEIEDTAVAFMLAYLGDHTVLNTRRMLASVDHGKQADAFQKNYLQSSPEKFVYPWVGDDSIYGLWSSTPYLYEHRRSPEVLYEILRVEGDGEGGYFTGDMCRLLFLSYPLDFLAVVKKHGLEKLVAEQMATECGPGIRPKLRMTFQRYSHSSYAKTALSMRRTFESYLVGE